MREAAAASVCCLIEQDADRGWEPMLDRPPFREERIIIAHKVNTQQKKAETVRELAGKKKVPCEASPGLLRGLFIFRHNEGEQDEADKQSDKWKGTRDVKQKISFF